MSSFAIFTDKDNNKFSIDVHFNLWNQSYNDNYLDIGIMTYDLIKNQKLYIWLPFKINSEQINDLKDSLEDIDIINAIFNENYILQREGKSKWINLYQRQKLQFRVYLLDIIKDIKIVDQEALGFNKNENISVLEIDVNFEEIDDIPKYLRFRVRLPEYTNIIHEYNRPHHFIRGAFSKNYIIDFRYNDKRSFSASENEIIDTKYYLTKTKKLHFLLMTKVYVDVECSVNVRKRRLESNLWKKYVLNGDTVDIIAYHATKNIKEDNNSEDIGSWEFFAKQTVETKNWFLLLSFIILTIIFGAIGSIIGNNIERIFLKLENLYHFITFKVGWNIWIILLLMSLVIFKKIIQKNNLKKTLKIFLSRYLKY